MHEGWKPQVFPFSLVALRIPLREEDGINQKQAMGPSLLQLCWAGVTRCATLMQIKRFVK